MAGFKLKNGMKLGVATAATQIEGGDTNNSWYDWAKAGHIKDGSSPLRADDHWARWREDIELLAEMGVETYRFGVEWSRIEPEEGIFDEEVLAHYREELELLLKKGIKPLLTLHHFTNPRWFESLGAFLSADSPRLFLRFAERTVRALGSLCSDYITINEPNVYAFNGLFAGDWPPGKQDIGALRRAYTNFTRCHIMTYKMIHRVRAAMGFSDSRVSFANHLRVFDPLNPANSYHRFCANLFDTMFQGSLTRAMMLGDCHFPVEDAGLPLGRYYDFIGINYYSRSVLYRPMNDTLSSCSKNDLGWEIYPAGLARLARTMYRKYKAPIWITENGTADSDDRFRSRYIYEHLAALCAENIPVERYYHWSFLDNFEWLEGESARFGIVHVDYETQKRTIKDSGRFFSEIIHSGGCTQEMYERFVEWQKYGVN